MTLAAIETPEQHREYLFGKTQTHPVICTYTGLVVGAITVSRIAGYIPYLSQWKESQARHPLFSLGPVELLNFSRSLWNHICQEGQIGSDTTEKQETLLKVATLALLHNLSPVTQEVAWLPTLASVTQNWQSILQLSYWKHFLDSKRFTFPGLRISKYNPTPDLHGYLQECWGLKKEYEKNVRVLIEEEKAKAKLARDAVLAIRLDIATKVPKSKKILWKWFAIQLPKKYNKDLDSWMEELFMAETASELEEFTIADVNLFEEIVLAELELGSSMSHEFLKRLGEKRKLLQEKLSLFEIIIPHEIEREKAAGNIDEKEPVASSFTSRAQFIVAQARWRLAHTTLNKHSLSLLEKSKQLSVKASPAAKRFESVLFEEPYDDESNTAEIINHFAALKKEQS